MFKKNDATSEDSLKNVKHKNRTAIRCSFVDRTSDIKRLEELNSRLPIKNKKELAVTGFDLLAYFNAKPGKWLGEALDKIEIAIVLGEVTNEKETILNWLVTNNKIKNKDS